MSQDNETTAEQIRKLTSRLEEAEETLRAVRCGEIDAFIVQAPEGERIYSLRSAEQPYRNLVEDMFEGAAILTTDGDIAYCNSRFAELVNVPLEDAVGGTMERFINSVDRPAYRALLAAGAGKRRTQLISATGHKVDVALSITTSVCDEVERRNLIITDLSELLDAQSSRDRAEQQSQAKDEFMAMLAHELRNPLSAVTAAMEVLDRARDQEPAASRARSIISRQVQHLSRLVDDLLDVGRVVTGKIALERRPIDLSDLIRRTCAVFTGRQAEHEFEVTTDQVWVDGDPVRVEQIISNIVGNAVKYTPRGGRIQVRLSAEGGHAVMRVQDNGLGITADLLPRVFDLFVQGERTLDRAQGGLGIGLTLVKRLVTLHHGTVSVESDGAGQGCVFTVRLPRTHSQVHLKPESERPSTDAIRRRVLVVEDNRDAREMFKMMLELEGHEVTEAADGRAGLDKLNSQCFDVAFIDVGLPGLDGYEVARRYLDGCDGRASVLLVALTGYGTAEAQERSRRAGFAHHLIKPVNPHTLFRILSATDLHRAAAQLSKAGQMNSSGLAAAGMLNQSTDSLSSGSGHLAFQNSGAEIRSPSSSSPGAPGLSASADSPSDHTLV